MTGPLETQNEVYCLQLRSAVGKGIDCSRIYAWYKGKGNMMSGGRDRAEWCGGHRYPGIMHTACRERGCRRAELRPMACRLLGRRARPQASGPSAMLSQRRNALSLRSGCRDGCPPVGSRTPCNTRAAASSSVDEGAAEGLSLSTVPGSRSRKYHCHHLTQLDSGSRSSGAPGSMTSTFSLHARRQRCARLARRQAVLCCPRVRGRRPWTKSALRTAS
jgi:hypothetical protein